MSELNRNVAMLAGGRRAMIMQCVDGPHKGNFGVHMVGGKFTCPLPVGYSHLSQAFYTGGRVFITHPGQKTLVCDFNKGTATPII